MEAKMKIVKVEKVAIRPERRTYGNPPSIVYVNIEGENVWENLENRRCRPYTAYKHLLAPHLQELGIPVDAKLAWNQKAGCSCPCSPGFNVKVKDSLGNEYRTTLHDAGRPVNIYVTISAE
jgi:hypothetical protein